MRLEVASRADQRQAHNPEVAGSNPAPATKKALVTGPFLFLPLAPNQRFANGLLTALARA